MNYKEIRLRLCELEGTQLKPTFDSNTLDFQLPGEYELFLQEVGAGTIGNSRFQFYDGVVFADELLGRPNKECEGILIFGDDYQGNLFGFNESDGSITCISSYQEITKVADSFEEFISEQFP